MICAWIFSAFLNTAKKRQQAQQKKDAAGKVQPARPAAAPAQEAAVQKNAAPPAQPEPLPQHHSTPLEAHMHVPEMGMEGEGTEGVDCCHEYMLDQPAQQEAPGFLPLKDEEEKEKAQALLQGVIFSESLGCRPIRRRYGGKRA